MAGEKGIIKLAWPEVEEHARSLAAKIKADGFQADYLVGITVGGLIPLALLSKELGINQIVTVSASSYEKDKQRGLEILYLPEIDLRGKRIILIDEIADTGETLRQISGIMLEKYKVAGLKTATLAINQEKCLFRPDYFSLAADGWVVFPWEYKDFPEYFQQG